MVAPLAIFCFVENRTPENISIVRIADKIRRFHLAGVEISLEVG